VLIRDTQRRVAQLLLVRAPHLNSGYFWVHPRISVFVKIYKIRYKELNIFPGSSSAIGKAFDTLSELDVNSFRPLIGGWFVAFEIYNFDLWYLRTERW
jgi:hypothetical protein